MRKGFTPLEIKKDKANLRLPKGDLSLTGFTLVELLLAIGIFSIIAMAIYSTFSMGVNAWRKMDGLLERYQEVRLLLDRMGVELRNCVDMQIEDFGNPEEKYDFYGEKDRLFFLTLKGNGVKWVGYQNRKNDAYEGEVFKLERRQEDFIPRLPEQDKPGDLALDLVRGVEGVKFKYLKLIKEGNEIKREWQDTWKEDKVSNVPPRPLQVWIRITFMVPTGRENEYQDVTVDKYVDIITVSKTVSKN